MENDPKKEEPVNQEETDKTKKEETENLEELKEVIKKLEEMSKNDKLKKPRRRVIAIEFGGVFHHNRIINFIFTYILSFTIAFFVAEIFNFVVYRDIIYFAGAILLFNVVEEVMKSYMLLRHFRIVLRTFGLVFYFIYVFMFFIIDQYIFVDTVDFVNEIGLPFYVLFFAITRYVLGQVIRNFLRYQTMR